jgi:hypothetical protein
MTAGKDRHNIPLNMRTIQVQSYAELDDIEYELTFEFEYTPSEKGSRGFYGEQIEPDTHGRMDFNTAIDSDGMEVDVLPRHIEAATDLAWQQVSED